MKQLNNTVLIAAAGSGKTSDLVKRAIDSSGQRILITTFTIDNTEEIRNKFYSELGYIPSNVTIQTWFSFLLRECARPYQNFLYDERRIENIEFVNGISAPYVPRRDTKRYYFREGRYIYTDKLCDFIFHVNRISRGMVISRLEKMYDLVMIDEVQDLAGTDLDFLQLLLRSEINTILVGDNRQATYFTNNARRNKKYKGTNIFNLFEEWEKEGICNIEFKTECHRGNQLICDIADSLYPEMPSTTSTNKVITGHDGIFYIKSQDLQQYIEQYKPVVLRYDKRSNCPDNLNPLNFGKSKGLTFERVLILANGPIKKFLQNDYRAISSPKTKAGLYVAITRARYSVTFVTDQKAVTNNFVTEFTFDKELLVNK
ncbi:UvrD-helicase domain-containing protein [Bacillus sp. S/N-304-OC-R1]|uniref:UvrD-helicase domain-containing protein n=1 Tax=Bacillus sp. S/N-304-OC-R1 TaxID=2758034 RepID=UPI001C8E7AB3|nr:UvrD-helicase domain-containing protein [Bacillus sp. S/N-304-OC-R1]MBY0124403.1 UvrD-helicase domain-containing protein [Bacillus sp. S/N-304-OC-R1]